MASETRSGAGEESRLLAYDLLGQRCLFLASALFKIPASSLTLERLTINTASWHVNRVILSVRRFDCSGPALNSNASYIRYVRVTPGC